MYGLTPQGFKRKTYEIVIQDMETRARALFGENVNLTVRSPLGIFIRIIAWFHGILWQLAEQVYNSAYVDTAEGVQLDYVGKYIGIRRNQAVKATGEIQITGDAGTVIPIGFIAETTTGIQFSTVTEGIIGVGGTVTLAIQAVTSGKNGNVSAGTITEIVTPTTGVESVMNLADITGGQDVESDENFRDRYSISVSRGGSSTGDSIRAKLLDDVPGVRAALVIENDTNAIDSDGRPPKCIECVLLGGSDEDIAKAILNSKAAGIQAYGSTTVVIQDSSGNNQNIGFSYAEQQLIYANVIITSNAQYPSNGDDQVKLAVIKYIGGTDDEGNVYTGLSMGEDVIYHKIIAEIYKVPGVEDVTLEIGIDGISYNQANISIPQTEVAETNSTIVVVS
ncbi:baseplate J/gp47 family protein [Anaerosolibacter sp.]|uniref:baseplate J/gp47 family protein n=1 Tax=Anaerosolibacter sp. TaxID=1872527 RepID=UPI0039F08EB8